MTEPAAQITQDEAVKQGYSHAQRVLRENHREEFLRIQKAKVTELGYPDWKPAPTKQEKAEQALEELLTEHSHLVDRLDDVAARVRASRQQDEPLPEG